MPSLFRNPAVSLASVALLRRLPLDSSGVAFEVCLFHKKQTALVFNDSMSSAEKATRKRTPMASQQTHAMPIPSSCFDKRHWIRSRLTSPLGLQNYVDCDVSAFLKGPTIPKEEDSRDSRKVELHNASFFEVFCLSCFPAIPKPSSWVSSG